MSTDILRDIQKELPKVISSANFEGANIVFYTDDMDFFKDNNGAIKELVNKFKKRIELRADQKLLKSEEETQKEIKRIIPEDAGLTEILFDPQRSIVIIEAKRPGLVIGKSGLLLKEIKDNTFWIPQIQRSPAIKSKITENIRAVLYQNNNTRKKFLNAVGKKIYKEWNPEKIEGWIRLTFLGGGRQVGRSCILLSTPQSKILLDCGVDVAGKGQDKFPYLNVSEFKINELDAIVLTHAHLDHSGLIPYLFKMGFRGPVYMSTPTRDIAALLALDFIGVAYKQAAAPLFSSTDIKEMVKHTICLNFNEVTDIAPDMRITLYNSGHALGSALVHINVGNGAHNLLYSGDMKFIRTKLLERAVSNFPRLETMIIESTYGSKSDILPPREESENELINTIKETIEKKGKVLIPELGLGRAQETMLVLEEAMRENKLPKIPIYIDGMIWDINGIHTAYPDFLNSNVRTEIFQDNNPFVSDIFKRVGSAIERKEVIEGGPCVVLATSGMLVGGASVEYFKHFASNKNNKICFVCYQGVGSLGRQVQDGFKQVKMNMEGKDEIVEINMEVISITGLTAHAGRNELLEFVNRSQPHPNRIIINHGEQSKCLDLASSIYKLHHIETNVPRNLETIRLR
ncbi:MAG: beta-CASP ribonuclease aCPSF1 [Nanoarchaeota archaeon]|nr:beta-CASP ribonuclease aCPSF1 [Nanoarchaeota archaeon]